MLFDIKKSTDSSKICECSDCVAPATNKLMLFGGTGIAMCDKCLENTVNKLSDEFQFRKVD